MLAYRRLIRRRVVVNVQGGRAFEGVLWLQRGPLLVLRNVTIHDPTRSAPVDGEVVIERRTVEFIQVITQVAP